MIPRSPIYVVSKILEQTLWPFHVKGVDMSDALKKPQRSDDLSKSVLMVDSDCQYTCKVCVQCQSSISCGAELLTARHLICASKRFFGCQICTPIL